MSEGTGSRRGPKPGWKQRKKEEEERLRQEQEESKVDNSSTQSLDISYTVLGHSGPQSKEQKEVLYSGTLKEKAFAITPNGSYHTIRYQEWVDGEKVRVQCMEAGKELVVEFSLESQLEIQIQRHKESLQEMENKLTRLRAL